MAQPFIEDSDILHLIQELKPIIFVTRLKIHVEVYIIVNFKNSISEMNVSNFVLNN